MTRAEFFKVLAKATDDARTLREQKQSIYFALKANGLLTKREHGLGVDDPGYRDTPIFTAVDIGSQTKHHARLPFTEIAVAEAAWEHYEKHVLPQQSTGGLDRGCGGPATPFSR